MKKLIVVLSMCLPMMAVASGDKLTLLSQVSVEKNNDVNEVKLRPLSELFMHLDIDGNGQLSLKEFEVITKTN
jgi:hypothetical protein